MGSEIPTPMQELFTQWTEALVSGIQIPLTAPIENDKLGKIFGVVTAFHTLGQIAGVLITIDTERSELSDYAKAAINTVVSQGLIPFVWISQDGEQVNLIALRSDTAEE